MAPTIWKFPLPVEDQQIVRIPRGARLVHVAEQYGMLCIWALVDPAAALVDHSILIRGTGHPAPDTPYVGSAVTARGDLVWHVFDGGEAP